MINPYATREVKEGATPTCAAFTHRHERDGGMDVLVISHDGDILLNKHVANDNEARVEAVKAAAGFEIFWANRKGLIDYHIQEAVVAYRHKSGNMTGPLPNPHA